jgi:hypothetical protein
MEKGNFHGYVSSDILKRIRAAQYSIGHGPGAIL